MNWIFSKWWKITVSSGAASQSWSMSPFNTTLTAELPIYNKINKGIKKYTYPAETYTPLFSFRTYPIPKPILIIMYLAEGDLEALKQVMKHTDVLFRPRSFLHSFLFLRVNEKLLSTVR